MLVPTKKEFRSFFRDRLAILSFALLAIISLSDMLMVALRVHSNALQLPVRYSQYSLNIQRGNWTVLYELGLFVFAITVINVMVAIKVYKLRRAYAIGALLLTLIICLVAFLVIRALVGLSSSL
jgi:uncharacterized membrane protein